MALASSSSPNIGLDTPIPIIQQLFLQHRWDWIKASEGIGRGQKPQWRTMRHQLTPPELCRLWRSPKHSIGVSFGKETNYALLDIDTDSFYRNPEGIRRIRAALETIGIVRTVLIRSSNSGGLHLWLSLPKPVSTFNLAVALRATLQRQGFVIELGVLEIFPNVKKYIHKGKPGRYRAHRLPLQPGSGSFMLNDDFNPVGNDLKVFSNRWTAAAAGQDIETLNEALATERELFDQERKSQHSSSFWRSKQTVQTAVDTGEGWTGPGQTNYLLGRFAWFGRTCRGLTGSALVQYIVDRVRRSPGYAKHCGHQHEIEKRARDWARSAEKLYKPYQGNTQRPDGEESEVNKNLLKAAEALKRLTTAVNRLRQENRFPETITERAKILEQEAGISSKTLYKDGYKQRWHPKFLVAATSAVLEPQAQEAASSEMSTKEFAPFSAYFSEDGLKPLLNKGFEKFYTRPLMKLAPPVLVDQEDQKVSFSLRDPFSSTRKQCFQGFKEHLVPKKIKFEPDKGADHLPRMPLKPPVTLLVETVISYRRREAVRLAGRTAFPRLAEGVSSLATKGLTESYRLTQLALVPGAEVTADTPKQLTEQLRTLQRVREQQGLCETKPSSRQISSA
ncbi:hypothetical protein H6F75_27410 [Nodosilinea sp. FACHB-131]|uniref:hypothetical protein n=1 Tax=Cyanophyceae TaxID=3028117 RepID=UPI00168327BA|nr:hypothetical protein [Nodosilinea sp. FACHB-131]MBD1877216.1 hypothetical protein [Nodosilinea sp. FACHB-131]